MKVRTETRFNNSIAVLRGPLYFSLRIGQNYRRPRRRERLGNPADDAVELRPRSMPLQPTEAKAEVVRNPVGDFPFAGSREPLFRRSNDAVVKPDGQISSYTRESYRRQRAGGFESQRPAFARLGHGQDLSGQRRRSARRSRGVRTNPQADLELVPYGCARLRISEYPLR